MKQVKFSVLMSIMLCVLIGYFEPANATKVSKTMTMKTVGATTAYAALNSTTALCPLWPNPIAPGATLTAISLNTEIITGGSLQSVVENNQYFVPIIAFNQTFPLSVVENNQYFVPDFYNSLTGTSMAIPYVADGNYVLTISTKSGNKYTMKLTISSK